jgi:hypothetical protein
MMYNSSLRRRRKTETVTIKNYAGTTIASGLTATREPKLAAPVVTDDGVIFIETINFYFANTAGVLPTIAYKNLVVDAASLKYEVLAVQAQGGESDRLKVVTKRYGL